ncbi:unnamed protein product [Phytophthora lilii]|uniref:Unnamed protein product n=1 Tax=Phytophthora lilii TaxID=2077276 RepID=A0A9W6WT35_9STRA|nr:unnamed protein product [Phytophthora lilii]
MPTNSCDYNPLAKSGAKDMLASAIAEVLTLRPRVPVAFLASHSPSFPSVVEKVFHDLAAIEAGSTPSLTNSISAESLPSRLSSATSHGSAPPRKARTGGPATISEASFLQLLQQLSMDFPKPLQTRLLETALAVTISASTKEPPNTQCVGLARFHRGVQACLLMEELMDAAGLLFQALEPQNSVVSSAVPEMVAADALLTALRSAASSQFPLELTSVLTPLLSKASAPRSTLASPDTVKATAKDSTVQTYRHLLQLSDVCELLLDMAFLE